MTDVQPVTADHPAKWSDTVLVAMHDAVRAEAERVGRPLLVLDPFAGVGRQRLAQAIHPHAAAVDGVELQPEWAFPAQLPDHRPGDGFTLLGDATRLPSTWTGLYDAAATSPCYGNRMADHHDAKDPCKACKGRRTVVEPLPGPHDVKCRTCKGTGLSWRNTYAHALRRAGGEIVPGSAAAMQWGREYRMLHRDALAEMIRVVAPGGLLAINMSNHIRNGEEQDVVGWWVNQIIVAGCILRSVLPIATPRNRNGANAHPTENDDGTKGPDPRVDAERLILAHTPTTRRLL